MFSPYINAIIYTECFLKIIAMGFVFGQNSYLLDPWNVLDFIVVFSGILASILLIIAPDHPLPGVSVLRTFRLLRPLRLVGRLEQLKVIISVLLSSLRALGATMGLALFIFTVYAILGLTIWSGSIHFRCYETERPVGGEWQMISGYTDLCSTNYPCPMWGENNDK